MVRLYRATILPQRIASMNLIPTSTALSLLAAGALLSLALPATPTQAAEGFALADTPGDHLDVLHDGKLVARYMYASDNSSKERRLETYKPYLHVFDAEGKAPITKGAGGDLPHHRAICVGWNGIKVKGIEKAFDRWHMPDGEQVHEKFLAQTADAKHATFTSQIRWTGRGDVPTILMEERTFTFLPAPAPAYIMIDLSTKIKAVAGDTSLNADPEHSGLQYRPAQELDKSKTTYYLPGKETNAHKDRDLPWSGENYTLNGKQYSVVQFSNPENPRPVVTSAYRDYGRMGLTFATKIAANETATYGCRFLIGEGPMFSADLIQKVDNEYTGHNDPTPEITVKQSEFFPTKAQPKKPAAKKDAAK